MLKRKYILIICVILIAAIAAASFYYLFGVYIPESKNAAEWERLVKEYYESKFALYQEENEAYGDYEVDVAFLGDSLTDGYDLKKYFPDYVTANRGIGGETSHGLEDRLKLSVYDLKPKVAVMLIGGNNLNTMLDNYENILVGLRDNLPDTRVILVSLTAMGGNFAHKNQIASYNNVIIKKLAEKYGFSFVDVFAPLLDGASGEIYSEYTNDGVHLTPEGYEVVTSNLTPVIESLLSNR